MPSSRDLAAMIDHTLLKADANAAQVTQLCQEALAYRFASVCVNPTYVKLCADLLAGSVVKVCTVVGFPLGATLPEVKACEVKAVLAQGATEVDTVLNIGALKNKDDDLLERDIRAVVQAAHPAGALVKVILETALLTDDEKVRACRAACQAGVDFVKTSTGFGPGGARPRDVRLMRETVGPTVGVKASGGIRSRRDALAMIEAGATRIGASASVHIVEEAD